MINQQTLIRKELIAIDICNTLADVNSEVGRITGLRRPVGLYFHPLVCPEWFSSNLSVFNTCNVIEGAIEVMNLLAIKYDILYLSARPMEAYSITVQWLMRNGFPKGQVKLTQNKVQVAIEQGIKFALDDAPHEISAYINHDISVYVKAQDYNTTYKNRFDWPTLIKLIP